MAIKFLQILFFIALFLMLTNKVHSHTTSFTVDNFSQNPTTLTYLGDARVLSGNKFLSVAGIEPTGEKKVTSVGRVLYSRPIRFWEDSSTGQVSFETTIRFRIKPSLYGAADGVAFFIAPVNTDINEESIWGQLGIYNNGSTTPNIFAVEFDTNINFWDPVYRHAGINIESRRSRNVTSFNAGDGNHVTARINYDANTKIITVVADSGAQHAEVSYVFDLKTILPEEVEVGIASTTGSADEGIGIPEIHAWYFTSTLVQASNNEDTYIKQYVQQV